MPHSKQAVPGGVCPYLGYSFGLHACAVIVAFNIFSGVSKPASPVYTIDFVGPSAMIMKSDGAPSAAPIKTAEPPPAQTEVDEFGRKRRKAFALPRPSLLRGWREKPLPKPSAAVAVPIGAAASSGSGGGETSVATDMPNFPYPWYISQVRSSLWNQWSARMPKEQGECAVVFTIMPDGRLVDLRTESSSGDSAFDLAALGAVQDSAPFPPLPRGFSEPFLKIHVTLKSL
ncbi:MAG: hypothetical protein A3J74_07985 [Elusimicrobia bacterium RIFCSPHIGHO2_02_FULL_57_9]|nr:MAG: hypothetical protein A3J74_07985 [Elusimicrobia bacterium RIFCSPHIGHO2_02_FULL_57_9]